VLAVRFPRDGGETKQLAQGVTLMAGRKVEFDAHRLEKRPTPVSFRTKDGSSVRFVAEKKTEVPVHVRFTTKKK
jgi:hypothetical protein